MKPVKRNLTGFFAFGGWALLMEYVAECVHLV